jgi:hypothetical protein
MSVTPALRQHVEHGTLLIDGSPKPMLPAVDRDDDLVQVPLVAARHRSSSDPSSDAEAELHRPATHGLVRHLDATRRQHLLDHAKA